MNENEADIQSNELQFMLEEMASDLQADVRNFEEYRPSNTEFPICQQQSIQNRYSEPNQSHSAELIDNGTLVLSSRNEIYLSPNNDFRLGNIRSMSVTDDNGMHTARNIKRNGTLPNLSKGSDFYFYTF
ncbi:hypothetical protein ACH3XW_22875 [Acanthocheilonema viteae]